MNILHYEYFGYGLLSEHKVSERGCYECADTAMKYLLNSKKLKQSQIILMGTSLGSGPTLYLAAKYRGVSGLTSLVKLINIVGVILETPFTSIVRTRTYFFAGRLIDMFENYLRIGAVSCPVMYYNCLNTNSLGFFMVQMMK